MSFQSDYSDALSLGKKAFLDFLNNSMPFNSESGTLEVSWIDRPNDSHGKWKEWFAVRDSPYMVEKINQRLIGIPELVLDLDPEKNESIEKFQNRCFRTIERVKADGGKCLGIFKTGSRGYHLHILIPELCLYPLTQVKDIKTPILRRYSADLQKASTRTMILLENSKHDKTGRIKCEVTL